VVRRLIKGNDSISLLVLGSENKDKKPGILVETISGVGYSIPVTVLPGNLTNETIDRLVTI
jgi:hypothetical protein